MSLKLNIGSGPNKMEGYLSIDIRNFDGKVDTTLDCGNDPWPWEDNSVEEVHCSHMIEHLKPFERIHFVNELHRVLSPEGKAVIIAPHWASCRAYGDLTHEWPPVSEFWFFYLDKSWRDANAPHNDMYTCDFTAVWAYRMNPSIVAKNPEYRKHAMANFKEAITDIHATLTKKS